jgi:hypothetical protein
MNASQTSTSLRQQIVSLTRLNAFPRLYRTLQRILTFSLVAIIFIFFRTKTINEGWYMVSHLSSNFKASFNDLFITLGTSSFNFFHLLTAIIVMEIITWTAKQRPCVQKFSMLEPWMKATCYTAILLWIIFFGYFGERPFIYFQF